MATTIRLTRMGKKKRPFYRLVVLDSRKRRDGAYLANLGYYNPFIDPQEIELHAEEIIRWLGKGAQISDTARSLLKSQGILYRYSLQCQGLTPEEIDARMASWRQGAESRAERKSSLKAEKAAAVVAALAKAEAEKAAEATRQEAEKAAAAAKNAAESSDSAESGDSGAAEPESTGEESPES